MPRSVLRQSLAAAAIAIAVVASLAQLDAPLAAAREPGDRGQPVAPARSTTVKPSELAVAPPTGDTPIKMSAPRHYPVDQNRYQQLKQQVDSEAHQREQQEGNHDDDGGVVTDPTAQFATLGSTSTGGWNPPDGALAVGPTSLLSGANEAFAIYNRAGSLLVGPTTFQSFFKEASSASVYDPRALYDAGNATNGYSGGHGRFVLLATDGSNFTLGVSQNETPENAASVWCTYQIPATSRNADGSTDWVDYPSLGMDGNNLYLTSNQFSNVDNSFQYARLMVVPKASVYPNSTTGACGSGTGATDFTIDASGAPLLQNPGGGASFTVQPANQPDAVPSPSTNASTPMYFVNSIWSSGSNLVVRTVSTGPGGAAPTLNAPNWVTSGFIAPYSLPANAPQPSSTNSIDAGDDRLLGATFRYGSIFTANTTGTVSAQLSSKPNPYANAQWYQITPTSATTSNARSVAVTNPSVAYFFPSILPVCSTGPSCSSPKVALEVSASGRSQPASAARVTNGSVAIFASGVGGYRQYSRWGDYSAVAADPKAAGTAWLFGEYARSTAAWGTAVTSVTP